jgi:hypothetical protein
MKKEYIAIVIDGSQKEWVYEGVMKDFDQKEIPLWVEMNESSRPKLMLEKDAMRVAEEIVGPGETIRIKKLI